ncbi:putative lipase [Rivularia sp. PCC 7116]|uniref:lipase family protein n=1 Tax=Rivularia sp. PCC 7116 TaxID=373994 RepID=UPI00029EF0FC|nr:lamin tail domain-containing protein [Rivularia sp. PCC 7116]AFY58684.1 putative lipase [Rivularia sp. PCC 7116]
MVGRFGKKIGNIGKNVVGKAVDKAGDVTEKVGDVGGAVVGKATDTAGNVVGKVGDITGGAIDKALDSKFAELFKKQSDVLLTQGYFDKFHFDTTAKNYSPYNAYSLGLASFLAYSVTGENGQDVSGKLELNKQALKNFLCKEDQQEEQTEAIFAKLDNWLSNFSQRNFITGKETDLIQFSREKGVTSTVTNSQAIVLKNEQIIIVAFRGSQELGDFFTDAQFIHSREFPGGFGVHNGFKEALMSVWTEVWEQIKPEARGERTLWFTGHSLGAGLANLATAMCLFEEEYSKNPPNGMYTYGQPKVGDENFVTAFNEKFKEQTFRFVNNNDIVPFLSFGPSDFDVMLPNVFKFIPKFDKTLINVLFVLDYYHCGNFKLFDNQGVLQDESFGIADKWVDRASGYLNNLFKLDPGSLNIPLSLNPLVVMRSILGRVIDRIDGIGDHFMSQYIVNLKTHLDKWERENPSSISNSKPTINTSSQNQQTQQATNNVLITNLVHKGLVKRKQSDEYIEITNFGSTPVDLSNWKVTSNNQEFSFPGGTQLEAGKSFRVYTNQVQSEFGGFSFDSSVAIWNDQGDEGQLLDADGNLVSNWVYDEEGNVTGKNRQSDASSTTVGELTPESVKKIFDDARKNSDQEQYFVRDLGTSVNSNELPNNVKQAYDFYQKNVEDADIGSAGVYEIPVNNVPVYVVTGVTDGDTGYLEIYSKSGEEIACGENDCDTIKWSDKETTRTDLVSN